MKIISWNVNGLRAVEKKGELEKLISLHHPDIFLIQETKAQEEKLNGIMEKYSNYKQAYNSAEKPGYSGTGIWIRKELVPEKHTIQLGMPHFQENEGRVLAYEQESFVILSVYFPNGGKSEEAWLGKLRFYDAFLRYVDELKSSGKDVLWAGDVNCAHEEIDIARPKENENSIGFLPEERAWVSKVISHGWIDVFRKKYPNEIVYSWWHLISKARERNVGWRIDYAFLDEKIFQKVYNVKYLTDQMGSDHCPLLIELHL